MRSDFSLKIPSDYFFVWHQTFSDHVCGIFPFKSGTHYWYILVSGSSMYLNFVFISPTVDGPQRARFGLPTFPHTPTLLLRYFSFRSFPDSHLLFVIAMQVQQHLANQSIIRIIIIMFKFYVPIDCYTTCSLQFYPPFALPVRLQAKNLTRLPRRVCFQN